MVRKIRFFSVESLIVSVKGLATQVLNSLLLAVPFLLGVFFVNNNTVFGVFWMLLSLALYLFSWGWIARKLWGWK